MKTLLMLTLLAVSALTSFQAYGQPCSLREGTSPVLLFNSPDLIQPYNREIKRYSHQLGELAKEWPPKLTPEIIRAMHNKMNAVTNNMDNLAKETQETCGGDLYTWNQNDEIPSLNAVYVVDATSGQQGWADLTVLLENTTPEQ